jgi:hypothetical protein
MKKYAAIFLQALVALIGAAALFFLLWMPQVEGRNANATFFEIYFKDPFLAYVYVGSIPFFVGVHQAFKALGYVRQGQGFSPTTAKALQTIRYCAIAVVGFVVGAFVFIMSDPSDDRAGGVFMCLMVISLSLAVAHAAGRLERLAARKNPPERA